MSLTPGPAQHCCSMQRFGNDLWPHVREAQPLQEAQAGAVGRGSHKKPAEPRKGLCGHHRRVSPVHQDPAPCQPPKDAPPAAGGTLRSHSDHPNARSSEF